MERLKNYSEYLLVALAGILLGYFAYTGLYVMTMQVAYEIEKEQRRFIRDEVERMVEEHRGNKPVSGA